MCQNIYYAIAYESFCIISHIHDVSSISKRSCTKGLTHSKMVHLSIICIIVDVLLYSLQLLGMFNTGKSKILVQWCRIFESFIAGIQCVSHVNNNYFAITTIVMLKHVWPEVSKCCLAFLLCIIIYLNLEHFIREFYKTNRSQNSFIKVVTPRLQHFYVSQNSITIRLPFEENHLYCTTFCTTIPFLQDHTKLHTTYYNTMFSNIHVHTYTCHLY